MRYFVILNQIFSDEEYKLKFVSRCEKKIAEKNKQKFLADDVHEACVSFHLSILCIVVKHILDLKKREKSVYEVKDQDFGMSLAEFAESPEKIPEIESLSKSATMHLLYRNLSMGLINIKDFSEILFTEDNSIGLSRMMIFCEFMLEEMGYKKDAEGQWLVKHLGSGGIRRTSRSPSHLRWVFLVVLTFCGF